MMENKINYQISDEVLTQVMGKVTEIEGLLQPYLIALSPELRSSLPKMSDGTVPFVTKCLDYTVSDPQFAPPFMDKAELAADMKVYDQLTSILRPIKQLKDGLDDTVMEAGAESYINALSYYHSVKLAARMDIPGAKAIYDDLKKRFSKDTSTSPAPAQP